VNVAHTSNLIGITGIARRLVLDGALEEGAAREALDTATRERKPIAVYLREHKLATPQQLAAANSIEFGMPLFDPGVMDPNQSAIRLVKDELLQKHHVLPLFKRGGRLFVGVADPTNTAALDEVKFHTNPAVEPILVAKATPKPIKWYIVGSDHGDHTAGNSPLPKDITYVVTPFSRGQMKLQSPAMTGETQVINVGGIEVQALYLGRDAWPPTGPDSARQPGAPREAAR